MDYVVSFLIGGLVCAAVQILLDRTKLMPGRVMVLLVCTGAVLGFCGLYEPFKEFAKSGALSATARLREYALAGGEGRRG